MVDEKFDLCCDGQVAIRISNLVILKPMSPSQALHRCSTGLTAALHILTIKGLEAGITVRQTSLHLPAV